MQRVFFLLAILVSACAKPVEVVKPTNDLIRITGRVKNDHDSITIYWPGTSIMVRFSGALLKAKLNDEHGDNYFNIIIDGNYKRYIKLDSVAHYYTLADNLTSGEHTIELIKRNGCEMGKTWFYGLEVTGHLLALPAKNKRVIEFFGNSITTGHAIENYTGGDSPDSVYTNNYYAYGAITARYFNADYYCTAKSGIGVMISWFPLIMPEMYDRIDPTDSLSKWNFKKVTPNIVVIDLFQNDAWLVNNRDHPSFKLRFGTQPPSDEKIIAAYKSFVASLRKVYPDASIICSLGPMGAVRDGSPWPGYIVQAVNQLHDPNIYIYFFSLMNKDGHPRREDNAKMATELIGFIEKNIRW